MFCKKSILTIMMGMCIGAFVSIPAEAVWKSVTVTGGGSAIQSAIDSNASETTIIIDDNLTYDGFIINQDNITVVAGSGKTPKINGVQVLVDPDNAGGQINSSIVVGASNIILQGLTIDDSTTLKPKDVGIFIVGGGVKVTKNGAPYYCKSIAKDVSITNNTLKNIKPQYPADSNKADRGYGIFIYGSHIVINGNKLTDGNTENIFIGGNSQLNKINGNHRGIGVLGDVPRLVINYNDLSGNEDHTVAYNNQYLLAGHTFGHYYPGSYVEVDVRKNWWGANNGPGSSPSLTVYDSRLPTIPANGNGGEIFKNDPNMSAGGEDIWFFPYAINAACTQFVTLATDPDVDSVTDDKDNCPSTPNGSTLGTCVDKTTLVKINSIASPCTSDTSCGANGLCEMNQEDADIDGTGDVCDPCPQDAGNLCLTPTTTTSTSGGITSSTTTTIITSTTTTIKTSSTTTTISGGGGTDEPVQPVLYVTGYVGIQPAESSKTFSILNAGNGTLTWNLGAISYEEGAGWIISVNPTSGSGDSTITITVNRTGLANGVYNAIIPISSNGGQDQMLVRLGVGQEVEPPPALFITPGTLAFGKTATEESLSVENTGDVAGTWNVNITYTSGTASGWLSIDPSTFSLAPQESNTLNVGVNRDGLACDNYTATIKFEFTGESTPIPDSTVVTVSMAVDSGSDCVTSVENPKLSIDKTFIFFNRKDITKQVNLSNTGTGTLTWEIGTIEYGFLGRDKNWLTASPASGTIEEGNNAPLSLTMDKSQLLPGFYRAILPVNSNGGNKKIGIIMYVPLLK